MARANTHIKDNPREIRLHHSRIIASVVIISVLGAVLIARLAYLQIFRYEHYSTISNENRIQTSPVSPNRGLILDRQGAVLVENRPSFSLNIIKEKVAGMDALLAELQALLDIPDEEVRRFRERLRRGTRPLESIPLRGYLSEEELATIAVHRHRLSGVIIETELVRHYPHGELLAHALGYVNRINERDLEEIADPRNYDGTNYMGRTGVERQYESVLHGRTGFQQVETNAYGRVMRVLDRIEPQPGSTLGLYLDLETQRAAHEALAGRRGAVVALETLTGGVIAFASTPAFDPNLFVTGISSRDYRFYADHPDRPLYNRAIQGQYPPGSTIKPMVALGALHYGTVTPSFAISDPGFFRLPGSAHQYRDWKKGGHGMVDVHKAVVQSCDTWFYTVAHRMGIEKLSGFLGGFGLGRKTGIDIPNELSGVLPSVEWKRRVLKQPWYPGETLIAAIGQGYTLMTPLQLAAATATLANRGFSVTPTFVRSIDDTPVPHPPRQRTVAVDNNAWWDLVSTSMEEVVRPGGTASVMGRGLQYRMAGKTGTAQVRGIAQGATYKESEVDERHRDHALFIAFAPAENPRIAVAVIVENGAHGSTTAAPIARKVIDQWLLNQPDFVPAMPPEPQTARTTPAATVTPDE